MESIGKTVSSFCRKNKKPLFATLAFLLLCAVVVGLIFVYFYIKTNINTDGLIFSLDEATDTYVVTGYEGDSKVVVITGKYNDKVVSKIGNKAFAESDIVNVTINGVETIDSGAFISCKSLQSVTLKGVVTIGKLAFSEETALVSLSMTDSVKTIGARAFSGDEKLAKLTLSDSLTEIPAYCFSGCEALTSIDVPDDVVTIGGHAFEKCIKLEKITFGDKVETIGEYAFATARIAPMSLVEVKLPASVKSIGAGAFYYNIYLEKVNIPSGVTAIEEYTFYECNSLTTLVLPEDCTSIGDFALYNCSSLQLITLPEKIKSLGGRAFYNNPWIKNYVDDNGFAIRSNVLLGYFGTETDIVLPTEGYEFITDLLTSEQNIKSIIIPSGSCRVLTKQSIISSLTLETLIIGEGVEVLCDSALYNDVALTYVSLPTTITTIEDNLFEACNVGTVDELYPTVYYRGTRSQWKKINIGSTNDGLLSASIVFDAPDPLAK